MEHKLLQLSQSQIKFKNDALTFSGYASVFNGVDTYNDTIVPGAYKNTLTDRERPILMRWNHFGPVIGKWNRYQEDEKGLYMEGELTPGHSTAEDVAASMKHGTVDGLSIGFMVKDYEEKYGIRYLKEIELREVSVVEEPADNMARVSEVKAAIEHAHTLKGIERILRDSGGFSKSSATALVSRIKNLTLGEQVKEIDTSDLAAYIQGQVNLLTKR